MFIIIGRFGVFLASRLDDIDKDRGQIDLRAIPKRFVGNMYCYNILTYGVFRHTFRWGVCVCALAWAPL